MTSALLKYKERLAKWMIEHGMGSIDTIWRDRADWREVPDWVGAILYIEESDLYVHLNGFGDFNLMSEFEQLLGDKIGMEHEDGCVIWLYDVDVLDSLHPECV